MASGQVSQRSARFQAKGRSASREIFATLQGLVQRVGRREL